jgi:Putative peptidoglycan binding domain
LGASRGAAEGRPNDLACTRQDGAACRHRNGADLASKDFHFGEQGGSIMRRYIAVALATVAMSGSLMSGGLVAGSSASAQAAISACTGAGTVYSTTASYFHRIPVRGSSYDCQLARGNQGAGVKRLQQTLNQCYSAGIDADSIFGTDTYNALRAAQRAAHVSDDGSYGPNTRRAMKHPMYRSNGGAYMGCSTAVFVD